MTELQPRLNHSINTRGRHDCQVPSPAETRSELTASLLEVARGSEAALNRVYVATRGKLYGICLRVCGDHACAADALQDTYLAVWRRARTFNPERASPITWLAAVARNKAIDTVRRRRYLPHSVNVHEGCLADHRPCAEQVMLDDEAAATVAYRLSSLDVSDAELIRAIYDEELTYSALAARVGRPVTTVKSRVKRAIVSMRAAAIAAGE